MNDLLLTAEADAIQEAKNLERLLSIDQWGINNNTLQSNQEITVFWP